MRMLFERGDRSSVLPAAERRLRFFEERSFRRKIAVFERRSIDPGGTI